METTKIMGLYIYIEGSFRACIGIEPSAFDPYAVHCPLDEGPAYSRNLSSQEQVVIPGPVIETWRLGSFPYCTASKVSSIGVHLPNTLETVDPKNSKPYITRHVVVSRFVSIIPI